LKHPYLSHYPFVKGDTVFVPSDIAVYKISFLRGGRFKYFREDYGKMFEIHVEKVNDKLIIKWQLTKIEIPISDILEVTEDNTYGGEVNDSIRIGFPYGTADRIIIKTKFDTYVLFTRIDAIKKKLISFVNN
jgi:hypothetical protein